MTGRSLHDALLTVLGDGPLRARLLTGDTSLSGVLGREEWAVLSRVSGERLCRLARFLARHYYRERIVRLFRHVRTLTALTGRDPLGVLTTPAGLASLDQSVLGTPASAERVVLLVEESLLRNDAEIKRAIPYWRDLVRYHATMFRVEAGAPHSGGSQGRPPRRTPSTRILELDWDIPGVIADLRKGAPPLPTAKPAPTCLLVARARHGRVTAVRCSQDLRLLVEAADGQRSVDQLAQMSGLSVQDTGGLLRQLEEIGAVV